MNAAPLLAQVDGRASRLHQSESRGARVAAMSAQVTAEAKSPFVKSSCVNRDAELGHEAERLRLGSLYCVGGDRVGEVHVDQAVLIAVHPPEVLVDASPRIPAAPSLDSGSGAQRSPERIDGGGGLQFRPALASSVPRACVAGDGRAGGAASGRRPPGSLGLPPGVD